MKNSIKGRVKWIDLLRSVAIIIMVFANSAAYFYENNVNVTFRLISSLAAPLFIFLAGANLYFAENDALLIANIGLCHLQKKSSQ